MPFTGFVDPTAGGRIIAQNAASAGKALGEGIGDLINRAKQDKKDEAMMDSFKAAYPDMYSGMPLADKWDNLSVNDKRGVTAAAQRVYETKQQQREMAMRDWSTTDTSSRDWYQAMERARVGDAKYGAYTPPPETMDAMRKSGYLWAPSTDRSGSWMRAGDGTPSGPPAPPLTTSTPVGDFYMGAKGWTPAPRASTPPLPNTAAVKVQSLVDQNAALDRQIGDYYNMTAKDPKAKTDGWFGTGLFGTPVADKIAQAQQKQVQNLNEIDQLKKTFQRGTPLPGYSTPPARSSTGAGRGAGAGTGGPGTVEPPLPQGEAGTGMPDMTAPPSVPAGTPVTPTGPGAAVVAPTGGGPGPMPAAPVAGAPAAAGAPVAPVPKLADGTALAPQDAAALQWARSNPNDPRAAKILSLFGN